ncbi:MAG: M50 family metallopeptidase [Actinobacteria bacterium]|nr:M50 family metallopeptidase [Actinomycetota bacterium]
MNIILQYVLAISGFSLIIIVHEFGHFIFAKINNIFVEEFFIGMGPKILKFKTKSGTLWGLSAIPIGGYNKISGMDREEKVPEDKKDKVYYKKSFWVKFSVIFGGAFMNVIFAIILLIIFFGMGIYAPLNSIDYIEKNSPAQIYGLKVNDKILYLNEIQIKNWDDFSNNVKKYPGKEVVFKIQRDDKELNIKVKLGIKDGAGYLGISPKIEKVKLGFTGIIKESFKLFSNFIITYFKLLGMLFAGKLSFSQARPVSPIGVVNIFQQSAAMGFQNFILLVALVSLILGVSNLIPLLPLDGGHIIINIVESIRKKPVSKKAFQIYSNIGIIIFGALFVIGFLFDIIKPININNM